MFKVSNKSRRLYLAAFRLLNAAEHFSESEAFNGADYEIMIGAALVIFEKFNESVLEDNRDIPENVW